MAIPQLPDNIDKWTSNELIPVIAEFTRHAQEAKATHEMLSKGYEDLKLKRQEMEKILETIRNNMKEVYDNLSGYREDISNADYSLDRLRRLLELAYRRESAMRAMRQRAREYMDLTSEAIWRPHIKGYQLTGALHLASTQKVIIGDEMGLGKTIQVLAAADMTESKKIIIFSNKTVLGNIKRELGKWTKRTIINFVETPKKQKSILLESMNTAEEWTILCNFEAWFRHEALISDLIDTQADTVIIDEAHALKDENSKTRKGIKKVVHWANLCPNCGKTSQDRPDLFSYRAIFNSPKLVCTYCAYEYDVHDESIRSVKRVYPMTGTIVLNEPQEMWSLLNLIDPKGFPLKSAFVREYCIQKEYYDPSSGKEKTYWAFKPGGVEELQRKIPYHILVRKKKALIASGELEPLPAQEIKYHNLEWREEYDKQKAAYDHIKKSYQIIIKRQLDSDLDERYAVNIQNVLMRLRQALVWPAGIKIKFDNINEWHCAAEQSLKLDYAENLIRELVNDGQRVVLFSMLDAPLQELYKRLQNNPRKEGTDNLIKAVAMTGKTPTWERDEITADFDRSMEQEDVENKWNVLLAQYAVAGQSVTLTGATQMIMLDRAWNPGKQDQASGRIDRIGQTEETTVHIIQLLGTVDIFMDTLISIKREVIDGLERTMTNNEILQAFMKELEAGTI